MSLPTANRQHAVNLPPPVSVAQADRTPVGDAVSALAAEVLRVADLLHRADDDVARRSGVSAAQCRLLAALEPGPATVAQVSRRLGLARQSVQRVADDLAARRLVGYRENPADRRAQLVVITPQGVRVLGSVRARQASWAEAVGAGLDQDEVESATAALRAVRSVLTTARDAPAMS